MALRSVSKSFPGVHALSDISFDVKAGEVHALLGENGAGKSTLIKILSGVYTPDSGELEVDGVSVRFNAPAHAQARGIATIYQEFSLYPELSVAENIFAGHMPRRGKIIDWSQSRREAGALLKMLDAEDLDVRAKVGTLSVGNRQRIEIAKALSRKSHVLILDEPTAVLTKHDADKLFSIVRRLREQGVAIIYISHRLEEIFALADRITVLRDGKLVGRFLTSETDEAELIRLMVGRALEEEPDKTNSSFDAERRLVLKTNGIGRRPLLQNASIEVREGEIVGLAGLVGSGRSELAQAVFGTSPAEQGSIEINGVPVKIHRPEEAIKLGIAYVPEDRQKQGLITALTVDENIGITSLSRHQRGPFLDFRQERQVAEEQISSLRIKTPSSRQLARNLSGGNQQKVVLAKWLTTDPKLLIVDEPTRGIDVSARAEIHRLLDTLAREKQMAILVISSDLPEVLRLADRIYVMRNGLVVAELTRSEANQERVLAAALGRSGETSEESRSEISDV